MLDIDLLHHYIHIRRFKNGKDQVAYKTDQNIKDGI